MKNFRVCTWILTMLFIVSYPLIACSSEHHPSAETELDSMMITEPDDSELASESATVADTNIAPQNLEMTAKELYLAIHEEKIPFDKIADYPVFRAEVEQKFSDYFGHPIAWEDLSFAIGDITDMYHYFFWIQDSEAYITQMRCAVNAYQDADGSIKNGLAWGGPWSILGSYTFGDEILRIDETYFINKTKLDALFPKTDIAEYQYHIQYDGIRRYAEDGFIVPTICDGVLIAFDVSVDPQMQYQMLPGQAVDLMAFSPYDFLVTHRTLGLTPEELMEYFPNHPLNPQYVVSGYMGVDDILQSEYRMYSGFDTQPYIRVKDDDHTDVVFGLSLPQTPVGEVLELDDITEDTTYQDLAWVVWMDRET